MNAKQAMAASLATLGAVFDRTVTPEMVDGYALILGDVSAPALAAATKRALAECRFMPTPAELLEFAGRGGTRAMTAEIAEAWGAVRAAMDKHDYTTSVDFGPLVNSVVNNIGGWLALCNASVPDLEWRRKKFEEVYAAFRVKPSAELPNGVFCRGAFGGEVVRIPIGGKEPPKLLTEKESAPSAIVRELAESKSLDRRP